MMNCSFDSSSESSKSSKLRLGYDGAVYLGGSELHIWYLVGYAKLVVPDSQAV